MKRSLSEYLLLLPNAMMPGKQRRHDVPYGAHPLMRYDEYPASKPNAPLVLFWYGGGWKTGHKGMYRFMGHMLQQLGVHAFVIDYPKYPERTFPGFIDDAHAAVNHIRPRFPNQRIYLAGHSAGGNTALLAGMTMTQPIDGIIALAAPCTLPDRIWFPVFGEALRNKRLDPRSYVNQSPTETRFFLIHGSVDKTVLKADSISLHDSLRAAGRSSTLSIIGLAGHASLLLLLAFGPLRRTRSRLRLWL